MASESATIVQRLWNYCHVLRDDGVSYGDYVEQLTYLLFLKMADEQTKPPFNKPSAIPAGYDWPSLVSKEGREPGGHRKPARSRRAGRRDRGESASRPGAVREHL